jgi:hypothetical protein
MKGRSIFAGIISLVLVFGTMAVSCDNGTNPNTDTGDGTGTNDGTGNGTDNGTGTDGGAELTYISATEDLVIVFKEPAARVALATGTLYEIYKNGNIISHGTITVDSAGTTITFTTAGNKTFTATISGGAITFAGSIIKDDGGSLTVSGSLSKEAEKSSNPFVGTWDSNDQYGGTVTVTQDTWQYSNRYGDIARGTYTYIGNTATYRETYNNYGPLDTRTYVTTIVNGVFHTKGIEFFNKH